MGGETYPIIVYGFKTDTDLCVDEPHIWLGVDSNPGTPVYYGPRIKNLTITSISEQIHLYVKDANNRKYIEQIDNLHAKYREYCHSEPTWLIAIGGDLEVNFNSTLSDYEEDEDDEDDGAYSSECFARFTH